MSTLCLTTVQAELNALPPRVSFWITQAWVNSLHITAAVSLVFEQTQHLVDPKLMRVALALHDFNADITAEELELFAAHG